MRNISALAIFAALAFSSAAHAQPFAIDWYTVDGGGGTSAGGSFTLSGTIGQPDAGVMSGGSFTLSGGFWVGGGSVPPNPCDFADANCDGALNGFDVEAMEQAVNGDFSNYCLSTDDPNQDGASNGFDIEFIEGLINNC